MQFPASLGSPGPGDKRTPDGLRLITKFASISSLARMQNGILRIFRY